MLNGTEVENAETNRLIDGGRCVSTPRRWALVESGTQVCGGLTVPLAVQAIDLDVTTLKLNFKRGQVKIYEKRVDLLNVQYISHMI